MDAFRKGASRFRKQFGHGAGNEDLLDEAEYQRHQQLERLYTSTRAGKHFQREIVRGVEGFVSSGCKQSDVASKVAEDCRKYGTVGPGVGGALARASAQYCTARIQMEKERDSMHRVLGTQVAEPLRAMVNGAPLEDARQLTQRYDRLRQETESQAMEVNKRRVKEASGNPDDTLKLQVAVQKMGELTSSMAMLGKEAAAAMTAVEIQQQRVTLQRMIAMVEAERAYHQKVGKILDQLQAQMAAEQQLTLQNESNWQSEGDATADKFIVPTLDGAKGPASIPDENLIQKNTQLQEDNPGQKSTHFFAEVTHAFEAEDQGELSISVGEYVVVRQVSSSGWSEGECNGQAGWFPSGYVVRRDRIPGSKVPKRVSGF